MVPERTNNLSENRLEVSYENVSQNFRHSKKDFSRQFCHMYSARLKQMRAHVTKRAEKEWGGYAIRKLSEMREENEDKCVLIGTLFKHQELKPSILKEVSEENKLNPLPTRFHFVDDEDILILEDELQRIRLIGNIDIHRMATGIVCAVLGYEQHDGRFLVESITFSECNVQRPLPAMNADPAPMLMLISGLSYSSVADSLLSMHLCCDWLSGLLGNQCSTSVVRLIIAGNSVRSTAEVKQKSLQKSSVHSDDAFDAINELDGFLEGLCSTVPVDIMAGEFDPSNHMLPQQPLNNCLFPKAYATGALQAVTNPYHCQINECTVMGTSGQPIQSLLAYTRLDSPMEALRSTLQWRHLAPTAPDTLGCYPYRDTDPFIITELPHIYFAGNCSEFATEMFEDITGAKTRLICIPEFYKKQTAVLVNLNTLDCNYVSFAVED